MLEAKTGALLEVSDDWLLSALKERGMFISYVFR